jgi:hypothetical protein
VVWGGMFGGAISGWMTTDNALTLFTSDYFNIAVQKFTTFSKVTVSH